MHLVTNLLCCHVQTVCYKSQNLILQRGRVVCVNITFPPDYDDISIYMTKSPFSNKMSLIHYCYFSV